MTALPHRRYTKRQLEVMQEWYDHTGWEFMEPNKGERFSAALARNWRWMEDRTTEALCIGTDLMDP